MLPITETLTPELIRLLELVEGNLFFIAKTINSRDQAIAVKERMARPLGVLGSRFGLKDRSSHPSANLVMERVQILIDKTP